MTETSWQSLAHARWEGKSHVVFMPKYRRKAWYGEIRASLGGIFPELARQQQGRIVEGQRLADHVHLGIEIPPKPAVASILGFLKGKSAVASARQFGGRLQNFTGAHCWARGSAVSTGGDELEAVKRDIRDQEAEDQAGRFESPLAVFETAQPSKPPASRGCPRTIL
jgi:putative transposase